MRAISGVRRLASSPSISRSLCTAAEGSAPPSPPTLPVSKTASRGAGAIEQFMRSKQDDDASEEWAKLAARGVIDGPHGELSAAAKADVANVLTTVYGPKRALEKAGELAGMRLDVVMSADEPLAPLMDQYRRTLEHNTAYKSRDAAQAVLTGLEKGLATIDAEAALEADDDDEEMEEWSMGQEQKQAE